jgi:sulfate transport system permease protein
VVVALPLAALATTSLDDGAGGFWSAVSSPEAAAALKLSVALAALATLANAILGTITAWVLVRDSFRGKGLMNSVIDLPFALPTIVAGLVLLALYGPQSPVGVDVAFTRAAIFLALLFVTLPFVVRTVQPVLYELDHEMEEAARSAPAS